MTNHAETGQPLGRRRMLNSKLKPLHAIWPGTCDSCEMPLHSSVTESVCAVEQSNVCNGNARVI